MAHLSLHVFHFTHASKHLPSMADFCSSLQVLYEDNHLLVLNKPAGIATMGAAAGEPSMVCLAKDYLAKKYDKPGNVYLGVVSRLDATVSGVLPFARTSKAATRLSAAFRERQVQKLYWAVVAGEVSPAEAHLEHYVRKDERAQRMHVTHADCPDAQSARLQYLTLAAGEEMSLLEVHLDTGRKHQIRVQLQKIGHPIVGDKKYGSRLEFPFGIALHAHRLVLEHPVRRTALEFTAPLPRQWSQHRSVAKLLASRRQDHATGR